MNKLILALSLFGIVACADDRTAFFADAEKVRVVFPKISSERAGVFGVESWRLEYFDYYGDCVEKIFSASEEGANVVVRRNRVNAILVFANCRGTNFSPKPAGAVYPHDFIAGNNVSWQGGIVAQIAKNLIVSSEEASPDGENYLSLFNWRKLSEAAGECQNPWREFDIDKACKNIAARNIRGNFFSPTKTEAEKRAATISLGTDELAFSDYFGEEAFVDNDAIPITLDGAENQIWTASAVFCAKQSSNLASIIETVKFPRQNF